VTMACIRISWLEPTYLYTCQCVIPKSQVIHIIPLGGEKEKVKTRINSQAMTVYSVYILYQEKLHITNMQWSKLTQVLPYC